MTISSENRVAGPYIGNDAATAFPFAFKVFGASDLQAVLTNSAGVESTLTLTTDYTVSLNANQDSNPGGTVTLPAVLATGTKLTITSNIAPIQATDLTNQGGFYPKVITNALDKLTILIQQTLNNIGRQIGYPISDGAGLNMTLPVAASRANKYVGFDANGNVVALAGSGTATDAAQVYFDAATMAAFITNRLNRVVDSIAALKALDKTKYARAFVIGYYAAGDGGGGAYYYDASDTTTADNGGSVIVATDGGRWKLLYTSVVTVDQFGAISTDAPGGSSFDSTQKIQAALDCGVSIASGAGKQYLVSTIKPRSNQELRDIRLKALPAAGAVSLRPVVQWAGLVGGVAQAVTNSTARRVVIDGNRQNLENIYTGAGEDGGMHGFKIADGAQGVRLIDCEASYCGTAGLALHSDGAGGAATYPIKNIYVENFTGTYNREHGMFGDSFDGFYLNGANLSFNGLTLDGGYASTHGNTGFTHMGNLFGSGFDLECYVGYPISYFKNFYSSNLVCKGNATQCMIYAPPVVDAVAEIPAQNIFMKNVHFEKGTNAGATDAFTMYANSFVGEKYGIDTVHLSGFLDGIITSNNVRGFCFTDGFIKAPSGKAYKALLNNGLDSIITCSSNRDNIQIETIGSPSVATNTGVGTLSITISQYVKSNGKHSLVMPFSVSGGLISGGNMSWTVTLPSTVKGAINAVVNAWNATSGKSVLANVAVLSATQVRIFMAPIDDNIQGNLELEVLI